MLEREFRCGTKTTKRAAGPKAAPGVPESVLREADVLRNAMPQTSGVEKASLEHCQAERYVQRAARESPGSAERLGQRMVSWVAGGDALEGLARHRLWVTIAVGPPRLALWWTVHGMPNTQCFGWI